MKLGITHEFRMICEQIAAMQWTDSEWSAHESDDWFQTDHFEGGYEASEQAFCFSYVERNVREHWFQVTLAEVQDILAGRLEELTLRPVE